jgi:hypothetical protein
MTSNEKVLFVRNNKKYEEKADLKVLLFIADFLYFAGKDSEAIYNQFANGYCYYFAVALKAAFNNRGEICWAAPLGHIVWRDDNGVAYDIGGVNASDCDYYIPISYISPDGIKDLKRIPYEGFNASKEYIRSAINKYKADMNIK